jgi:hypothetical protein
LPYAEKVQAFVEALGMSAPAEVDQGSAGQLLAALDRLWDCRDQLRDQLRDAVPVLQKRADKATELAVALLDESSPSRQ